MTPTENKRLDLVLRHINNVRENCFILGEKLIEEGEYELGLLLIANGQIHDNSKLRGVEWLYLHPDVKDLKPEHFLLALNQHRQNNPHHPEFWPGGIEEMPRLYLAEMVCDIKGRSEEFGSDVLEWIKDECTKKYKFSTCGRVYKEMKNFLELLIQEKFK